MSHTEYTVADRQSLLLILWLCLLHNEEGRQRVQQTCSVRVHGDLKDHCVDLCARHAFYSLKHPEPVQVIDRPFCMGLYREGAVVCPCLFSESCRAR